MPLGVALSGPPRELTDCTNRWCSSGVQRSRVLPAGAAEAAGVRPGDARWQRRQQQVSGGYTSRVVLAGGVLSVVQAIAPGTDSSTLN